VITSLLEVARRNPLVVVFLALAALSLLLGHQLSAFVYALIGAGLYLRSHS
jgi:hypothetical protein